ncbi:MAG TPA: hypothetical protein VLW65_21530 [Bryobacteraceae bacterium]|nr:hypothetical protein [Bryobacteraceae bacterium]
MPKRLGLVIFLAFTAIFLLLNRAAYKGYFQDDELDTISWTPYTPATHYLEAALSPRFQPGNFRPVGHFYYYVALHLFGLDFPKWIALLHAIHLLNVWLLWLVLRRLGAPPAAAGCACLFFGLHAALFDAVWKPMYAFDVLCATFCLLAIFFYCGRHWLLAFAMFWLAYKAKEVAVMLPLVLAAVELWFGKGEWKRRWLPLAPFFAAALSFGLQGILLNPNLDNAYTFRFTPGAVAQTSVFYASRVFLLPYLGFALPLAALIWRSRRVWLGLAAMGLLFFPLLFLPGRMFSAYCYVPFIGLAILFAGVAETVRPAWMAAFFVIWSLHDVGEIRLERRATLALDDQVRTLVTTIARFARTAPHPDAVVYAGAIQGFAYWGEVGAIHYLFHDGRLPVAYIDDPQSAALMRAPRVALLNWNSGTHTLSIRLRAPETQAAYIQMDGSEPVEQLAEGWYGLEGDYRWTATRAEVQLKRPAGANRFELRALAGAAQIQAVGQLTVRVGLDGRELGAGAFKAAGWQTLGWDLPPAQAGSARVTISTSPPFKPANDQRTLGIAVGALGFKAPAPENSMGRR